MTKAEWSACENPTRMLDFLRRRATDRQLRLFACACCHSVWRFIPDGPCREAVEVSRRYADGLATDTQLEVARNAALAVESVAQTPASLAARAIADRSAAWAAQTASLETLNHIRGTNAAAAEEEARVQAAILRDIINPFQAVLPEVVRRWVRDREVRQIAAAVHDELHPDDAKTDMTELAAHLERLGCHDRDVLDHCRGPGPHVRGCWVIDLLRTALAQPPDPEPPEPDPSAGVGVNPAHPEPGPEPGAVVTEWRVCTEPGTSRRAYRSTTRTPELLAHQQWLGYLQPVGLVVSPPALVASQAFVSGNVSAEHARFLEHLHEVPVGRDEPEPAVKDLAALLTDPVLFGWQPADLVPAADPKAAALEIVLPAFNETLRPTHAVPNPDGGWLMLIQELPLATDLDDDAVADAKHWQASPQTRFERLLRATGVPIGLLCNRTHLRLVYFPRGE